MSRGMADVSVAESPSSFAMPWPQVAPPCMHMLVLFEQASMTSWMMFAEIILHFVGQCPYVQWCSQQIASLGR